MPFVVIKYCLSEAGRKKNIMKGGSGKPIQQLNLFDDHECFASLIEQAEVDDSGNGLLDTTETLDPEGERSYLSIDPVQWDEIPAPEEVLEQELERKKEFDRVREKLESD